ncbi:MAG: class I tRNA ligase family protein, partial [Planctomycetota bacterium]
IRWWVGSLAYDNDVKVDRTFFDGAGESYRKVRNTLRFMLSNLDDFEASDFDAGSFALTSLEAWVLGELDALAAKVSKAYESYQFKTAHAALYDFCNDTLSSVYLAAVKDRLYCDRVDSPRRRSTQAALHRVTDQLCRLLAPMLPHTADEAWRALNSVDPKDSEACVHLETLLPATGVSPDKAWSTMLVTRDAAKLAMERSASQSDLKDPLDMGVTWPGDATGFKPVDLADLLGVSEVTFDASASDPVVVDLRDRPRCERSWKRDGTVRERSDGSMLSDRDAEAVGV